MVSITFKEKNLVKPSQFRTGKYYTDGKRLVYNYCYDKLALFGSVKNIDYDIAIMHLSGMAEEEIWKEVKVEISIEIENA